MTKRIGTVGQSVTADTDCLARGLADAERRAQEFADRVAVRDAEDENDRKHPAEAAEKEAG